MLYIGGNGGEQTGRLVDEPGLDRREGEGHRLLCSLHRFMSSTLSLCLKKFRDNSLANKKQSFVIILIQLISWNLLFRWTVHIFCLLTFAFATGFIKLLCSISRLLYSIIAYLFQWYSIFRPYEPQSWLLLLAVMLSMGRRILPTPSLSNLQVLSWVWSGSVTETRKRINDEAQSWKIPSLTRSRSTLASASIQSMILILRSSSFCWSSGFYI